jgi:thioredoxin-related protein
MKTLLISILLISSLIANGEFNWENDYKKALKEAKKTDKDVYLLITSESCGWCRKFENTTLSDKKTLQRLKKSYVLVSLMKEWDDIPEKFERKRVPKHFFLKSDGEIIKSFLGYWNVEDFNSYLNDVDKEKKDYN